MRTITLIIVHCSANRQGSTLRMMDIDRLHRYLGWKGCGYHFVIPTDGTIETGRPLEQVGAHCKNHKVYGEATAVLAGDALLTAAFGHLAAAPLPASRVVKATRVLSLCAGELGMVGGQVLDMEAEHRVCTEEEVLAIQSRKTGALISAACQLGVIAAGGSPAQQQAAADYAASLGLAFQIEDDILDVVGDAAKLGKATGMDQNKNTFVRLHGVEACRARITEETQRAVAALAPLGQAEFLTELAQRLTSRDH